MAGDNFDFDISSDDRATFDMAMKIAFSNHRGGAVAYEIKNGRLVLFWHCEKEMNGIRKFPYEMNLEEACSFVWGWVTRAEFIGKEPDHDGDNHKGFRIFRNGETSSYGWDTIAIIEQKWQYYGK